MSDDRTMAGAGKYKTISVRKHRGWVHNFMAQEIDEDKLVVAPEVFDTIEALIERAIETTANLVLKTESAVQARTSTIASSKQWMLICPNCGREDHIGTPHKATGHRCSLCDYVTTTEATCALKEPPPVHPPIRLNHLDTNMKPPPFDIMSTTEFMMVACVDCGELGLPGSIYQHVATEEETLSHVITAPLCESCYVLRSKGSQAPETEGVTCVDCGNKIDTLDAHQFIYRDGSTGKYTTRPLCDLCYVERLKGQQAS